MTDFKPPVWSHWTWCWLLRLRSKSLGPLALVSPPLPSFLLFLDDQIHSHGFKYHHYSDDSQKYNLKSDLFSEPHISITNSRLSISIWMSYKFPDFNLCRKELDVPSALFLPQPPLSHSISFDLVAWTPNLGTILDSTFFLIFHIQSISLEWTNFTLVPPFILRVIIFYYTQALKQSAGSIFFCFDLPKRKI